jgi:hypothetical protein
VASQADWVTVVLTLEQYGRAMQAGAARNLINEAAGVRDRRHLADPVAVHVAGAAAELAWAIHLGVPWDRDVIPDPGGKRPGAADHDVCGYHVRSTCHRGGRLLVRPTDPDDAPFVLAYTAIPAITFAGWLYGREAKEVPLAVITGKHPAIPVHAAGYHLLRPVSTLPPPSALAYLDLPCQRHPAPRTALEFLSFPDPREDCHVSRRSTRHGEVAGQAHAADPRR